jgi:hypothetical protein
LAIEWPREVLPTPGGPTKSRMGARFVVRGAGGEGVLWACVPGGPGGPWDGPWADVPGGDP